MSGTFWEPQEEEETEVKTRIPLWCWPVIVLDLLLVLALAPVAILVVVPFFAVYWIALAQFVVWISPLLAAVNIAQFAWAFRRRQAGITGLSILGVLMTVVAWIMVLAWQAPVVVFGVQL
ncbi:hypothetical protein BN1051_01977 [Arthrobacter saudimassiliensis]|uniref:Uncharacterized protein n=1 Tax=Arthrobacter saudimassiliensis TaxID=1461584 RepID=A0A078MQR5_9MICC|nr:hypothetical protein BN1051_01977 [Arthrobacter saudimassiliensis]